MSEISVNYLRDNFTVEDRIAVVLLNKRSGAVLQRVASIERVIAPEYQAWLRHMNAQKYEVYISIEHTEGGNPSTDKRRCRPNPARLSGLRRGRHGGRTQAAAAHGCAGTELLDQQLT